MKTNLMRVASTASTRSSWFVATMSITKTSLSFCLSSSVIILTYSFPRSLLVLPMVHVAVEYRLTDRRPKYPTNHQPPAFCGRHRIPRTVSGVASNHFVVACHGHFLRTTHVQTLTFLSRCSGSSKRFALAVAALSMSGLDVVSLHSIRAYMNDDTTHQGP